MNKCDFCQQDKPEAVSIVIHYSRGLEYRYLICNLCASKVNTFIDLEINYNVKVIH